MILQFVIFFIELQQMVVQQLFRMETSNWILGRVSDMRKFEFRRYNDSSLIRVGRQILTCSGEWTL